MINDKNDSTETNIYNIQVWIDSEDEDIRQAVISTFDYKSAQTTYVADVTDASDVEILYQAIAENRLPTVAKEIKLYQITQNYRPFSTFEEDDVDKLTLRQVKNRLYGCIDTH